MIGRASARRPPSGRRGTLLLIAAIAVALTAPASAAQTITSVTASADSGKLAISVISADSGPLQTETFELSEPRRVVFDLPGACLAKEVPGSLPLTFPGLKQVRLGQFSADPPVARIVVDIADGADPRWQVGPGDKPSETLIVFEGAGPLALRVPSLSREGGCVLLRLPGAGKLTRSIGVLDKPDRVYVDIENASTRWCETEAKAPPVTAVRMGPQTPRNGQPVARVVIELREKQAHTVFADGPDLVIAVGPQPWALPLPEYAAGSRLKGKVIVVDPGHGGKDIGAPAAPGSPPSEPYEKDVTLSIARRLTALLKAEGASVTITRKDDAFVALQERAAIANKLKADALVSVHCNSCEKPNTLSGTSVYYDHPHSAELAAMVQSELVAALGTADKGVRNANFAVIRRTKGPGILVETAFINNDDDRSRLMSANAQERMARAIVQGVIRYLEDSAEATGAGE